jgi:hypothetical protein
LKKATEAKLSWQGTIAKIPNMPKFKNYSPKTTSQPNRGDTILKTCKICQREVESVCHKCEGRIHRQLDDILRVMGCRSSRAYSGRNGNGGKSSEISIGLNVLALSFVAGDDIWVYCMNGRN